MATLPTVCLGGCLEAVDPRRPEIELRQFSIANWTEEPARIDVRVERDGETVHEATYELEPRRDRVLGGATIDCSWGDTRGDYTLFAREDGGEWVSASLSEATGGFLETVDCATVLGDYRGPGSLDLIVRQNCGGISDSDTPCPVEDE